MKRIISCCLTLSALVAVPTFAEHHMGTFSVSAGGGYLFFDHAREIKNTGFLFGAVGYDFNEQWGVEATYAGAWPKTKDNDHGKRKANVSLFFFDGLYRFASFPTAIEPYVFAGVGVSGFDPNHNEARNEGNVNAGFGAQYFVHPQIAFRADARDFYSMVSHRNDVMVDVGLTFLFGC